MKRLLQCLTLLFSLSFLAMGLAQVAPLPDDTRFDQPVEFKTGPDGELLSVMIDALAQSIGLTAVVENVPEEAITYDIGDPKPFRQVWELVLTLNNLDYVLLENDVVVVGPPAAIAALKDDDQAEEQGAELTQRLFPVSQDPGELAEVLRQTVPGVSVSVLPNLNTLLVQGTQAQLDEAAQILGRFDVQIATPVRRVYPLSNADAETLAETLNQTLVTGEQESTRVIDTDDDQVADEETSTTTIVRSEDITIVADARTNSLVVTAPEVVQAEIARLIERLDIPQPQVNVQVRIQEINTIAAQRLGINLTAGLGNFAATFLDTGLSFIFDAQNAISGLNLGAVLDTLEEQNLSRRVDDSTLTLLNNSTGRIQSGGRIELTLPGPDGEASVRTLEFGVIIEVTPRISSNGRVILDINAEVSDLLVPLSEGGIPARIDFSEREVSSTVTLAPGQTVLLGGLFQNQFTTDTNSVPVLGSLPLIGNLFSTTIQTEENSELLLIVTADVIE